MSLHRIFIVLPISSVSLAHHDTRGQRPSILSCPLLSHHRRTTGIVLTCWPPSPLMLVNIFNSPILFLKACGPVGKLSWLLLCRKRDSNNLLEQKTCIDISGRQTWKIFTLYVILPFEWISLVAKVSMKITITFWNICIICRASLRHCIYPLCLFIGMCLLLHYIFASLSKHYLALKKHEKHYIMLFFLQSLKSEKTLVTTGITETEI